MRVIVKEDRQAVVRCVTRFLFDAIQANETCVLGLDVTDVSLDAYGALLDQATASQLNTADLRTFSIAEYIGLAPTDARSYRSTLQRALLGPIGLKSGNSHAPDARALDIEASCEQYEKTIRACGGIDLQIVGLGMNGQIGFNEPGSSLGSRTRLKTLTTDMVSSQTDGLAESETDIPKLALTMGVGTILESKRCLLLACGESKARPLRDAVEGLLTAQVTASAMQMHPDAIAIVDTAAAGLLTRLDYYREVEA